jgi:hypothetical protein
MIAPIWSQNPMDVQILPLREIKPNQVELRSQLTVEQHAAIERIKALGGSVFMHAGNEGRQLDLITYKGRQFTDDHISFLMAFSANPPYGVGFVDTSLSEQGIARALECFQSLKGIQISEMPVGDSALDSLKCFVDLEQLTLSETLVTSAVLKHIAGHKRLQQLIVSETAIDDEGIKCFEGMSNLERLFIGKTAVSSSGLKSIGTLNGLKSLLLNDTGIGDEGLAALSDLQKLETLRLDGTEVTNRGMIHIAKLSALKTLDVERTKVDEKGLALLQNMPSLREVRWMDPEKATPGQRAFFAKFVLYLPGNMDRWQDIRRKLDRGEITIDQLATPQ